MMADSQHSSAPGPDRPDRWRPRIGWGLLAAAVLLAAITVGALGLQGSPDGTLPSLVLVYLVAVVVVAIIGGIWPGVVAAVASDALLNWYFIPPYHKLSVEHRENVTALVVYVLVAVLVSVLVNLVASQRAAAVRSGLEAALLARIAAEPVNESSLQRLLEQLRVTFGFTALALWEDERSIAHAGPAFTGAPTLRVAAGDDLDLVAESDETIGEDRALLARLAAGAARTLEAQRLAVQAAQARELTEIDRLRTAILRAVGHDLRTPLAAIKAAASSLHSPEVQFTAEDRDELLTTVVESADRLDDLIENLLAMSRLQAGVLSVQLRSVAVDEVVARAALGFDAGRLVIDVPDDLPWVRADPGLLERVVANLIDNAIRATGNGTVTVRASTVQASTVPAGTVRGSTARGSTARGSTARGSAAAPETVSLAVVDHGPGIPIEERERVFAPFQRLDDHSAEGRLGLGLAIARGFTEAMGAALYPSPTSGGGQTMTIELAVVPS